MLNNKNHQVKKNDNSCKDMDEFYNEGSLTSKKGSLAMLGGLHSRTGLRSVLEALKRRSPLFDKQVMRLIFKLAGPCNYQVKLIYARLAKIAQKLFVDMYRIEKVEVQFFLAENTVRAKEIGDYFTITIIDTREERLTSCSYRDVLQSFNFAINAIVGANIGEPPPETSDCVLLTSINSGPIPVNKMINIIERLGHISSEDKAYVESVKSLNLEFGRSSSCGGGAQAR